MTRQSPEAANKELDRLLRSVISLLGLEPEPRYLVELGSGEVMEAFQRMLGSAR